jgi:hypothetical protein
MCNFYTVNLNFFNFLLLPAVVAGMPAVTALQFRKGARCHRQPLQVARLVPGSAAVGCAHSPDVVGSINSQEEQRASRPKNDFAVHDFAYFFRQNEQNFRKQFCLCCSTSVSQRHREKHSKPLKLPSQSHNDTEKLRKVSTQRPFESAIRACSQRHRIRSTAKGLTQKIAVSCVLERKIYIDMTCVTV